MGRLTFLPTVALFALLANVVAISPAQDDIRRPNVILIITDDQGYGDIASHGNEEVQTPNLDSLYDDSARFTDFHVDPTCSPTRAALMTGKYSTRVGVWLTYMGRHRLAANELTMADYFSASGYRTAAIGKWHLGDNYPYRPNDRGFDVSLVHGGGVVGEAPDFWGNDYYDDTYFRNGKPEQVDGYCTDVWFDEAIRFIDQDSENPFFIYLATNAPHGPLHVPDRYIEPYRRKNIPDRRARFLGMIECIDQNIGRLQKHLVEAELDQNTLLIFVTDNGTTAGCTLRADRDVPSTNQTGWAVEGFNAGMRGRKGTPFEGGHRAACFIRWPAGEIRGGQDISQLTAHFDLLPTLIELCKLERNLLDQQANLQRMDGTSLVPLLESDIDSWEERTLFVHDQSRFGQQTDDDLPIAGKEFCVMTQKWRLVGEELFDIENDPGQRANVADENPQVALRLKQAYEDWFADVTRHSDRYERVIIGSSHQERVLLTSQQWHGPVSLYNQQHVSAGVEANGFWDLRVARTGAYRIELRRWPQELDLAFSEHAQPFEIDPRLHQSDFSLSNLPIQQVNPKQAALRIGAIELTKPITRSDTVITFSVELEAGDVELQTWLTDESGVSRGAYFVTIEPIEN